MATDYCSENNFHSSYLGSSSNVFSSSSRSNNNNGEYNNCFTKSHLNNTKDNTAFTLASSSSSSNIDMNKELNRKEPFISSSFTNSSSNNVNTPHSLLNGLNNSSNDSSAVKNNIISNKSSLDGMEALINVQKGAGPIVMLFSIIFGLYFCKDNNSVINNNYYNNNYNNNLKFSNETIKNSDKVYNNNLFYFLIITLIEAIMHIFLNIIFTKFLTNKKIVDFLNICRALFVCFLCYNLQIICGINCPIYIIFTYKIIAVTFIFCYSRFLFGICIVTFILTSTTSYLHAICNFYDLNFRDLTYAMFIDEKQHNNFNLEYYNRKLFEIIFLQTIVGLVSWFFGVTIAKHKDLNIIQKIEIENEKFLSSAKTKFIGNLSHEARNNLNCLIGAIHLLRSYQKVDNNVNNCKDITNNDYMININGNNCCCKHCIITNPSINELIQDISDNANLLLKIFTRSLQMSTLELGDVKLNIQPFNLLSLFESMISVYSPLANEKGVSLHSFFNFTKVPIYLLGDHVRISQIFMNIISNAIKYTNKNGCVTVTCNLANELEIKGIIDIHNRDNKENKNTNNTKKESKEDKKEILYNSEDYHFVKIECKDTGKGISEKGLNELFTPFHTLDDKTQQQSTTTTNTQSTFDRYFSQSEQLKDNNVSVLLLQNRHGLGLSICKILIERMNGIISVKSKVNEGTTMTIVLPLRKINNNNNYNVTQNNNGINYTKDINDDDDHIIKVTMEEQRFKELEKLSEKITNYLLHIILIDNDKYFKETIFSYFNSFNSLINYQLTTCNDLNEMESIIINNSKNGGITTITKDNYQEDFKKVIIICTEDQFYNVEEKSKILFSNNNIKKINYQIVPTTVRSLPRKEKCFYLTKPIKLLDILEFLTDELKEFLPKELNLENDNSTKKEKIVVNNSRNKTLLNGTDFLSSANSVNDNNIAKNAIPTKIIDANNLSKNKLIALVVDDVATNVKILKKLLEIIGFTEIDTASNGLECFEKFKQKKYSIILLDCLMPVLNGIQSCEMIRNYEKDCNLERTTIIAITANIFESKESLIEKGFTSVLYKPITLSTLKQEIKLFIEDIK